MVSCRILSIIRAVSVHISRFPCPDEAGVPVDDGQAMLFFVRLEAVHGDALIRPACFFLREWFRFLVSLHVVVALVTLVEVAG